MRAGPICTEYNQLHSECERRHDRERRPTLSTRPLAAASLLAANSSTPHTVNTPIPNAAHTNVTSISLISSTIKYLFDLRTSSAGPAQSAYAPAGVYTSARASAPLTTHAAVGSSVTAIQFAIRQA